MTINLGSLKFDHARYDAREDVLYLSVGEPREAADSVQTPEGHVVRYDDAGEIIGITLINAKWLVERNELSVSVPTQVAAEDLEVAFA
jgi:uncharacterized protein YuzE